MKSLRLTLTAILTLATCTFYFFLFEPQQLYQAYRCLSSARPWYGCYLGGNFDFKTDLFGIIYEGNVKDEIDRAVLKYGAYEKPLLYLLKDLSNRGVFLDIGANTGHHSLFMSRYASEIHAFEPYAPVIERFNRAIEVNQIRNITIHPVGFGAKNETIPFYSPPETNHGSGSFLGDWKRDNTYYQKLKIVVGDELIGNLNLHSIDLIKMDIEGYEKPALKGLRATLARYRPILVFELSIDPNNPALFKSSEEIRLAFPDGYEFFAFEDADLFTGAYKILIMDQLVRFDVAWQYNIIAYPAERKAHIPLSGPQPESQKNKD
jgi:FkbM family methyltransferase